MKCWQGSLGISDFIGITSPDYAVFEPVHEEDSGYLNYLLRCKLLPDLYRAISNGIRPDQWRLEPEKFKDVRFPLPPHSEQITIVAFLDRETGKIDVLVEEQRRLIALLREKRQAVISHAVTKGLDPTVPMKPSGIEWLGDIPAHWRLLRFSRLVSIAEGQVDPREEPYASMPLIAPNHVESGTGRLLKLESAADQGAESGKYIFDTGAVIYSKIRPHLCKAVVAPQPGLCSADMYPLVSKGDLEQQYLALLLITPGFTAWAVLESDRVAMPKINREKLNELRLPVPPMSESPTRNELSDSSDL